MKKDLVYTKQMEFGEYKTTYLHHPKEFGTKKEILDMLSCCYENENGTNVFNVEYSNVYETEQEAEFIAKNYDTRVEKFEPPFELELYEKYKFLSKKYGNAYIYKVKVFADYRVSYFDYNNVYLDFDTYQEAVDYAHKLFKGEE